MRVLVQVQNFDIIELDVEVLIYRLQDTTNADVILELDGDSLVREGLEEAATDIVSALFRSRRSLCLMSLVWRDT